MAAEPGWLPNGVSVSSNPSDGKPIGQPAAFRCRSDANEVFLARSLLYAQRAVIKWGTDPQALYARAYAEALGGLHSASGTDFTKADTLWHAAHSGKTDNPPAWTSVIPGVDLYSPVLLTKAKNADLTHAPLYDLCTFLTTEQNGSNARFYEFGGQTLASNPACYRILASLCSHAQVGPCNTLTDMGPAVMIATLPAQLDRIADLPADLRQLVKKLKPGPQALADLADLTAGLKSVPAGDGELPLSVLGNMVYETQFVIRCHGRCDLTGRRFTPA
jgi:hypothetical protein